MDKKIEIVIDNILERIERLELKLDSINQKSDSLFGPSEKKETKKEEKKPLNPDDPATPGQVNYLIGLGIDKSEAESLTIKTADIAIKNILSQSSSEFDSEGAYY